MPQIPVLQYPRAARSDAEHCNLTPLQSHAAHVRKRRHRLPVHSDSKAFKGDVHLPLARGFPACETQSPTSIAFSRRRPFLSCLVSKPGGSASILRGSKHKKRARKCVDAFPSRNGANSLRYSHLVLAQPPASKAEKICSRCGLKKNSRLTPLVGTLRRGVRM